MTGRERMERILRRQSVDRIGVYEHFWSDTHRIWCENGWVRPEDRFERLFDFDCTEHWAFNLTGDLHFQPVTLDETEDTILQLDGNGAKLRRHKKHDSTPEHVGFTIRDRETWDEFKRMLTPSRERIDFEDYRRAKRLAAEENRFFFWSGVNVFECMHPVCGHEEMLVGMALDPDWVKDMVYTYSRLLVDLQEMLFAEEGLPDGIWYYEDMGFKGSPFMSPAMYREIVQPGHVYTFDYAKSKRLPILVHSCGMVEKLVPGLMEAGMDCLQVIEVKAGMDLLKLHKLYGDRLSFMGGIDVRKLYTNDRAEIDRELREKVPAAMQGFGYALHSDHSIPFNVTRDSYEYFIARGRELGTY